MFGPRDSAYAVNLTYDRHTGTGIHIFNNFMNLYSQPIGYSWIGNILSEICTVCVCLYVCVCVCVCVCATMQVESCCPFYLLIRQPYVIHGLKEGHPQTDMATP